jgi:hypothetical protein
VQVHGEDRFFCDGRDSMDRQVSGDSCTAREGPRQCPVSQRNAMSRDVHGVKGLQNNVRLAGSGRRRVAADREPSGW